MSRDINAERYTRGKPKLRRFRQARWDEPIIFELSNEGERGILIPGVGDRVEREVGDVISTIPETIRRKQPPKLPELSQPQVLRHYLRLSQETLGTDLSIDIGLGGCTMKYSPKINEQLARMPKLAEIHPLQPEETVQGILEVMYEFEQILKEISGLDRFSFQPAAGSAAIHANLSIIRAYHEAHGQADQRSEIITTIFSHPSCAACAQTAGFKVITLYPDDDGHPDVEALRAAVSERTGGLVITNPEVTGLFNPKIEEFLYVVHEAGGLCCYDQANANGILGITRAREAGFDLCHFNLHKTFSSPHGSGGPGGGAMGVTEELAKFLPVPVIDFDGSKYRLNYERPHSIGKVRAFYGVVPVVLRAYAWVMSLGADGLKEVAEISVLSNNYLLHKMLEVPGVSAPYAKGKHRIENTMCSWEELTKDTGVCSEDIRRRVADFGLHYWTSRHRLIVSDRCTLEPTESYSKAELDEYAAILRHVSNEAYNNPELVKTAPHSSTIHEIDHAPLDDPLQWAVTWRAYLRKVRGEGT